MPPENCRLGGVFPGSAQKRQKLVSPLSLEQKIK
jgi:hypothetical protein